MLLCGFGVTGMAPGRSSAQDAALPSFPGAEGFGAATTGGRGGKVYVVTTLEPHGPGSLGDALDPSTCEPRTVVFAVSGVIHGADPIEGHSFDLTCGDLTIAGQTAPGAGITIHSRVFVSEAAKGNIVMRHVRLRAPDAAVGKLNINDALQIGNVQRVMLDHISASWGGDETIDVYEGVRDITIQWSTIEASRSGEHPDGPNHNYALLTGPDTSRVSVHHTLFAHHRARCPAMGGGPAELVNSVIYDCQDGFVHHNPAAGEFHIVGNTFKRGPSHTEFTPLYFDDEDPGGTTYWLSQNDLDGTVYDNIVGTQWAEAAFAGASPDSVITRPTSGGRDSGGYVPISRQSPAEAYEAVLERAGAFPRDRFTTQTVDEVRNGTGTWGDIEPSDRSAFLTGLATATPRADADRDGMADEWERANGLDPADGADHATVLQSGYTAIEVYVNGLAEAIDGSRDVAATPAASSVDTAAQSPERETPSTVAPSSTAAAPSTAEPAPAVGSADGTSTQAAANPATGVTVVQEDTSTLSIVALLLGIVALVVAVVALVTARSSR